MRKSATQLVEEFSDTNNSWESKLDYQLVQEIVGRSMSLEEWEQLKDTLDDVVFETVIGFQYD